MTTEEKILEEAKKIFLLYGYHGTTVREIATAASVNKAAIHYYFRSKEKLYSEVVKKIVKTIINKKVIYDQRILLFVIKELQNNKTMFLKSLNTLSYSDWNARMVSLIKNTLDEISAEEFVKILK